MGLNLFLAAFFAITPATAIKANRGTALLRVAMLDPQVWQGVPGSSSGGGSGTPGGADTNVQYNNGGVFAGSANFTWNNGTSTFTVVGTSILAGEIQQSANSQLWTGAATGGGAIFRASADTPDTFKLTTGNLSNGIVICEDGDKAFDFAHAIQTNPTLFIHSATASTSQWLGLSHDGTNPVFSLGSGNFNFAGALQTNGNNQYYGAVGSSTAGGAFLPQQTALTPDGPVLATGTTSNSLHFVEWGDLGFDFNNGLSGTSAATDPAFIIHSNNQNTTEYNQLNFMGMHGGNRTTLTDNAVVAFAHTAALSANGQAYGGSGRYVIYVTDAAGEVQLASGDFEFTIIRANTGGTVCSVQNIGNDGVLPGLPLKQLSAGTLDIATNGLKCGVAANVATLSMQADTSLTPTSMFMVSQIHLLYGVAELIPD